MLWFWTSSTRFRVALGTLVEVAADQDYALATEAVLDGQPTSVSDGRVRNQHRPFLGELLLHDAPRGGVDLGVGDGCTPRL